MPDKIRMIQTGDLHLGSPFSFAPERSAALQQSQVDSFWSIIRLCQTEGADLLLIAGDLFDQPVPDRQLVRSVIDMLASLDRTSVLIVPGNHDPFGLDSPYRTAVWPDHVHVFGDQLTFVELPDRQTRVYGIGFAATVAARPLLPDCLSEPLAPDRINMLLIHGDFAAASSQTLYNALNPTQLTALGFDYVAMGHIHEFSGLIPLGTQALAAYAGCPFGRGFDEMGPKGVICGDIILDEHRFSQMPGQKPRPIAPRFDLHFTTLASRLFIELTVDVTGCGDQRTVADRIFQAMQTAQGEHFSRHLYKIVLVGELDETFALVPAMIMDRLASQVFYLKLRDRTHKRVDLNLLASEHSLRGAFVRQANARLASVTGTHESLANQALAIGLQAMQGEDVSYEAD